MQNPFNSALRFIRHSISGRPQHKEGFFKPRHERHANINMKELLKRRAKNKAGRKQRRINRLRSK